MGFLKCTYQWKSNLKCWEMVYNIILPKGQVLRAVLCQHLGAKEYSRWMRTLKVLKNAAPKWMSFCLCNFGFDPEVLSETFVPKFIWCQPELHLINPQMFGHPWSWLKTRNKSFDFYFEFACTLIVRRSLSICSKVPLIVLLEESFCELCTS